MNNSSSSKNIHFDEDWSSHPVVEWIALNKNLLLGIFTGLLITLILASQIINWRTISAEKDYFQAQTLFTQFQQSATQPAEVSATAVEFEQLEALLQRHPELKPKYDGALAQTFLINGQITEAQTLMNGIFSRTQADHLQLYQDYAKTSLLIGQGQYQAAIDQALQLKASLDQLQEGSNPLLYVFNLIRLAALYQQTAQTQAELNIWDQFQNQTKRLESVLLANQTFKIGQATLNQYIEDRRNILSSKKTP